MNIPHKQLSVDINRKNQYTVDFIGHVNDKDVRYIDVTFNAGGTPITLEEGCTATVTYVSEGVLIDQAAECTVSGSTVVIGVDSEKVENLRSGILEVQPKVVDPNGRVLTMQIPILVRISPDIAEHGQVDDDSLGSYAEVVREIAAARGTYQNLKQRLDNTAAPTDEQVEEALEDYFEEHPLDRFVDQTTYNADMGEIENTLLTMEDTTNKQVVMPVNPTDSQYLSARATKNYVDAKLADIEPGNSIWKASVAPTNTGTSENPIYRFDISDLTGADRDVQIGDMALQSYYYFMINNVTDSYAYAETRVSIRGSKGSTGATGATGAKGDPGDDYVLTAQDKAEIAGMVDVSGEVDAKINGSIPSYWESAVDTAIGKVKAIQRAHGADCINLVWFSDIHLMASIGNSNYGRNIPALARRLINKLDIPFVISTGDSATNSVESTEAAMRDDFDYFNNLIKSAGISDKFINCYGNHDGAWGDNRQGSTGYTAAYAWHIRPRDYWNDLIRNQTTGADRHYSEDGSYGYVDLPAQKLRIIQLNSFWVGDNDTYNQDGTMIYDYFHHGGYGQDQLDWLAEKALSFNEDGWSVLFMAHMPPAQIDSSSDTNYLAAEMNRDATILNGILTAYANKTTYQGSYSYHSGRNEGAWANVSVNVDYSSESHYAKPVAFLAGHCHRSRIDTTTLPFPIITITCATNSSYDSTTEGSRTNNSVTETAFDVISICKDEEKIYLTRLGVGSDRETNYTPILPVINQIPISTDDNGEIYNGTGYKDGYRYNSSMGETAAAGYFTTGRIPVADGALVTLDGFVFPQTTVSGGANVNFCRIVVYRSNGIDSATSDQVAINFGGTVVDNQITNITIDTSTSFYSNVEYIAFSGYGSGANAAIYVE